MFLLNTNGHYFEIDTAKVPVTQESFQGCRFFDDEKTLLETVCAESDLDLEDIEGARPSMSPSAMASRWSLMIAALPRPLTSRSRLTCPSSLSNFWRDWRLIAHSVRVPIRTDSPTGTRCAKMRPSTSKARALGPDARRTAQ